MTPRLDYRKAAPAAIDAPAGINQELADLGLVVAGMNAWNRIRTAFLPAVRGR
jgi:hypothetical protein